MSTVEQLKKELEELPEDVLDELDQYIHDLRLRNIPRKKLPTFHLKGQFDQQTVRDLAYE